MEERKLPAAAAAAEQVCEERPDFRCPITQGLMLEPVLTPLGHSFEAHALRQWLCDAAAAGRPGTCPMTRQPLALGQASKGALHCAAGTLLLKAPCMPSRARWRMSG